MARNNVHKKSVLVAGRGPHGGLAHRMVQYLEWQQERNTTASALRNTEHQLTRLLLWCEERGCTSPAEITLRVLERYQRHLYQYRKDNGEALSVRTQYIILKGVKHFFSWLTRRHYLESNPASELEMPKQEQRLPRDVLSHEEAERLINWPDVNTVLGLRDRAILEVLYSTGMRRMELAGLTESNINAENQTVMIYQGKGRKDRLIPLGARALNWVRRYQSLSRPKLADFPETDVLFLTQSGLPFTVEGLSGHVTKLIRECGVREKGSCHLLRHTMATQMLENGADTRWIQAMLGHACISTTQIYTRVSIRALREIHRSTHPAECGAPEPDAVAESPSAPQG